jgi:hypothetical protein
MRGDKRLEFSFCWKILETPMSRLYLVPALILWSVSMSWLFATKILPTLIQGNPPDYAEILPSSAQELPPIRWSIRWNHKNIGWAENRISRSLDGSGRMFSIVQFEQLPVAEIFREVLGVLGRFAEPLVPSELGPLDVKVATQMDFDHYGVLDRFETRIDLAGLDDLLRLEGRVAGETLDLSARVQSETNEMHSVYHKQITLPPDALLADSFSPRPQLKHLRLGQSWTFQSYRPFAPTNPLELIQASVEGEELIDWNGQLCRAKVVEYRRDSGSGISSTRTPISRSWVLASGDVVRQELTIGQVRVQFIREPAATGATGSTRTDETAAETTEPSIESTSLHD